MYIFNPIKMKVLKSLILFPVILCFAKLQSQEIEAILLAKDDAQKLAKAYFDPAFKGLIFAMNNGWYHTAEVHKKFGFDLSIGGNAALIPSQYELFSIAELGLSNNTTVLNGVTTSPTIAGSKTQTTAELQYSTTIEGQSVTADFTLPEGIKDNLPINAIPAPSVQLSVGLPYKLETIVRYVPKVGNTEVKMRLFGLGFKKEITDLLGDLGKTPLHVSLLAAYSNTSVDYEIGNTSGEVSTENASTEFDLNTYTIQAIASLNFPVFNLYGGIGYNAGNIKLNMLGTYILEYDPENNNIPNIRESVTDPISLKTSSGTMNATIGARLSLGFFKIYGSYTLQDYSVLNAGIAFSFR